MKMEQTVSSVQKATIFGITNILILLALIEKSLPEVW
jgi:hypothetical protein